MLATLAEPPLTGRGLAYEPKYDGIRALVHVPPPGPATQSGYGRASGTKRRRSFLQSRARSRSCVPNSRRPCSSTRKSSRSTRRDVPAGFQRLQGRIHLSGAREVEHIDKAQPVAIIAFDLLRDGDDDIRGLPLTERRRRLEAHAPRSALEHAPHQRAGRQTMDARSNERARGEGWEGLIVKEVAAPYQSGRRSPTWRKLKLVQEQEFVVGGWTEPRHTRQYFGALLLGVYDEKTGALTYVGHTGTGFNQAELERRVEAAEGA